MGIHHKLGISGIFTTAPGLMLQPALNSALTGSTVEDSVNGVAHPE